MTEFKLAHEPDKFERFGNEPSEDGITLETTYSDISGVKEDLPTILVNVLTPSALEFCDLHSPELLPELLELQKVLRSQISAFLGQVVSDVVSSRSDRFDILKPVDVHITTTDYAKKRVGLREVALGLEQDYFGVGRNDVLKKAGYSSITFYCSHPGMVSRREGGRNTMYGQWFFEHGSNNRLIPLTAMPSFEIDGNAALATVGRTIDLSDRRLLEGEVPFSRDGYQPQSVSPYAFVVTDFERQDL